LKTHCVVERRATIGSSTNIATRNRNLSTGSFIPIQGNTPQLQQTSPTPTLISNLNRDLPPVREHRKLDRSISEPVGDRNLNNINNNMNNRQNGGNINSSRYKTELCRPFEESGHCKYGDKCQFAHGSLELRTLSRHPKYKTDLCRTYHTIGFCPYGPRCHFIHNEEERKLGIALQQQEEQQRLQQQQSMVSRQSPPLPVVPTQLPPQQVKRPSTINFNSSFNGSLGSAADSPPSSASESPSLSPTLFTEEIYGLASQIGSCSNSVSTSPVFNYSSSPTEYSTLSSYLTPLNVQTQHVNSASPDINALQQQFNALLNLNQRNNNHNVFRDMEAFVAPPSPPDSISGDSVGSSSSHSSAGSSGFTNTCGSALDVSKSLRLPIFNRLSQD